MFTSRTNASVRSSLPGKKRLSIAVASGHKQRKAKASSFFVETAVKPTLEDGKPAAENAAAHVSAVDAKEIVAPETADPSPKQVEAEPPQELVESVSEGSVPEPESPAIASDEASSTGCRRFIPAVGTTISIGC